MKWGISCTAESEEQLGKVLAAFKSLGVQNIGYDAVGSTKRKSMEEWYPLTVNFVSQNSVDHFSRQQIIEYVGSGSMADKIIKQMVKEKIIKKKAGNGFLRLKKAK